jgi:hypothetical protein
MREPIVPAPNTATRVTARITIYCTKAQLPSVPHLYQRTTSAVSTLVDLSRFHACIRARLSVVPYEILAHLGFSPCLP